MQLEINIRDIQQQIQMSTAVKEFDTKIDNFQGLLCQAQVGIAKFKKADNEQICELKQFSKDCAGKITTLN